MIDTNISEEFKIGYNQGQLSAKEEEINFYNENIYYVKDELTTEIVAMERHRYKQRFKQLTEDINKIEESLK